MIFTPAAIDRIADTLPTVTDIVEAMDDALVNPAIDLGNRGEVARALGAPVDDPLLDRFVHGEGGVLVPVRASEVRDAPRDGEPATTYANVLVGYCGATPNRRGVQVDTADDESPGKTSLLLASADARRLAFQLLAAAAHADTDNEVVA